MTRNCQRGASIRQERSMKLTLNKTSGMALASSSSSGQSSMIESRYIFGRYTYKDMTRCCNGASTDCNNQL